jgi:hypothetical protein
MDKLELAKRKLALKRQTKSVVAEDLAAKIGSAYASRDIKQLDKTVEGVLDGIGEKLDAAISKLPQPEAPVVTVETDTSKLEDIAKLTTTQIEALQSKLDAQPTIGALGEVKSEISALKAVFGQVSKALEQDIYARYDYTNSIEENGVRYIGYLNKDSEWFIQRLGSGSEGESSTFATGKRGEYKKAWSNRLKLQYVLRDKADIK